MPGMHSPERKVRGFGLALVIAAWATITLVPQAPGQVAAQPLSPPPLPARSASVSVQDLCRIEGQGESVLRGIGIVTGLKGTGDSAADLVIARPLAEIYKNNGLPIGDLKDLAKGKSAAIVAIECVIPEQGARRDDKIDVFVTVLHSAASIDGGRLTLAPLTGPFRGDTTLYAMASGPIEIERTAMPTVGRIKGGARVVTDVLPPALGASFNLVLHPDVRDYTVTTQLADAINALQPDLDALGEDRGAASIARAIDDAVVRVDIPAIERTNSARFVSRVLTADFNPNLLRLPAQVLVNSRTGCIIVTGNVEISSVVISHKDLVISTTTPAPVPSPQQPFTDTRRSTSVGTTGRASDRARIQDLLQALKSLDVSVEDQISILTQIHRVGRLHARLVID